MKLQYSFNRSNRLDQLRRLRNRRRIAPRILCAAAVALFVLLPGNAFGTSINSADDAALSGALLQDFDRSGYFEATESSVIQYSTARSGGNDRALIDDFSYVVPVPEPNVGMLLGLGLLALAGSRFRQQAPDRVPATRRRPDTV
jgi:hypothetical protein